MAGRSLMNGRSLPHRCKGGCRRPQVVILEWDHAIRWAMANSAKAPPVPVENDHRLTEVPIRGLDSLESAISLQLLSGVPLAALAQRYSMSIAALRATIEAPCGLRAKNPWVARWGE